VTIGAVEQHITETAWTKGWVLPIAVGRPLAKSVAIIGAGPAGLAAAEELRKAGIDAVIYDSYDRAGGLLIYGIPNFKLEKSVVERRVKRLEEAGVGFRLNVDVGRDVALEDLRARHDGVLIAAGAYRARTLDLGGERAEGVLAALEYLTASNRKGLGDRVANFENGRLDARGKRVVVIGGGDTAMDCVRTAVRQGASSVTCVYRRDRANMPGSRGEVRNAEEEGVRFEWLAAPKALVLARGFVAGVEATRMRLGAKDASGRGGVEAIAASEFRLPADLVVKALGFEPEDFPTVLSSPGLQMTSRGTLRTRAGSFETSLSHVFAAGDAMRGASLVVWAIADGRRAGAEIAARLSARRSLIAAE
jgi:glutamate synthase (NADPH/NADH) small chain